MAKSSTSLLTKVKHATPGDHYHYDCPQCGDEHVVLLVIDGQVHMHMSACPVVMSEGQNKRQARFAKDVLAEIEELITATPKPAPAPAPEPVIPGAPDGPNFVVGPDEGEVPDAEA